MTTTERKPPGEDDPSALDISSSELLADQFATMLAAFTDGFWRFDGDARLLEVNDAYCRMSGYTREELLNMRVPDLEADETEVDLARHIARVRDKGFYRFETRHRRKDGETWDVEISVSYWKATGQFLLIARDITARVRGIAELKNHREHLEEMVRDRTELLGDLNARLEEEIAEREQTAEALRESQRKYQALAETTNDFIWEVDRDARYTYCSPQMEKLWGLKPEDMIGKTPFDVMPPDERETGLGFFRQLVAARQPFTGLVTSAYVSDNRHIFLETSGVPFFDNEGNLLGYRGISRDVTERIQAEEALARTSSKLAEVLNSIQDDFYVLDRDWNFVYASERFTSKVGKKPEDFIGNNIWTMFPKHLGTSYEENLRATMEKREVRRFEIGGKYSNAVYEMSSFPSAEGVTVLGRDVTERKKMEEALVDSEQRLRIAQRGARVGVWELDPKTREVKLDSQLYVMYGLPEDTVQKQADWEKSVHPEDLDRVNAEREAAVARHEPFDIEFRAIRDGEVRWINTKGSAVYNDSGEAERVFGVNIDITERKRTEEALRGSEEKYRDLVENANTIIIRMDNHGRISFFNDYAQKFFGYSSDEVLGQDVNILIPTVESGTERDLREMIEDILADPDRFADNINENVRKNGERVWVSWRNKAVRDAAGDIVGNLAIGQDITASVQAEQALRQSESRYRLLADSITDGFYALDSDWRFVHVNDATVKYLGKSREELMGHHLLELFPDVRGTVFETEYRRVLEEGEIAHFEAASVVTGRDLEVHAYPGPGHMIVLFRDITERKRAEAELTRATERMQKLLSANVIGIAEFDATKIVSANRALMDMTGYSARDVVRGKVDWREMTPPEYAERDNRAWREMIEHGECLPYEKEYFTRDGRRLPILIAGVRLTEDPVTGVFLNLDITDWKLLERELQETAHFAEHLFDSSLIGLTRFVDEGLVDANDAFLKIVGFTRDDLNAHLIDIRKITPAEYAPFDADSIKEMLATGEALSYEKEYIRKDGTRVPVLIGRKLIRKSPLEWIAFVLDISERKRIGADLERVRTEFLGEVSHELKTPLTAIKGCASMALSSSTPPTQSEARELFEVVDTQANRLTDLVGNLLDMTRIEGGRLSIEPDDVDIARIIDESRVIFEHSRYPQPLLIDLPPGLPLVRADSRRTVQVLTNLYSNAAKFSPAEAPVRVSAESKGSEVLVHVKDQGVGIPDDKMSLLFQKFVRIHTVGARGTGLGLFICKGIVEAQGGRIWAESAGQGKGSTISFALPAAAPAKRTVARGARQKKSPAASERRIVAIDDEPHILRFVGHTLASAGYDVASTTDPLEAAKLVKSKEPDLVLLDMRLPGTSGLAVLEKIRGFSDVPVVFITATANREDVLRGRQFGGTTWLEKPFSPQQLLEHVREILSQRRKRKRKAPTPLFAP